MEVVLILRILWRRRLAVAAGLALSLAVGYKLASAPPARTGIAWTTAALDTRPSQVVAPTPAGAETLGWRAALLGHLMLAPASQQAIADELELSRVDLAVIEPELNVPAAATALPRRASEVTASSDAPNVLTVTSDDQLATITLLAAAPDPAAAVRLAVAGLNELSVSASAAETALSSSDRSVPQAYEVDRSATIESETVTSGGGSLTGAAATLVLASRWCGAIAMLPGRRPPRRRGAGRMASSRAPH